MRANNRVRERFELALDARQVAVVLLGSLVILGGVFVLGVTVGRHGANAAAPPAPIAAPKDSLARLDEPLPREEPAPELKAHQALTDGRTIEQSLPVAPPKAVAAAPEPPPTPPAPPAVTPAAVRPPVARSSPEAEAAVASKPAVTRKGGFTIQVAASPKRSDAERMARKLAARGPRIVEADVPGKGRWYRVQIGSYDSQEAARRQLAALSREGVSGIVTAQR